MWEFNGLPLHPLIVHAAVVFGPVSALVAIAYAVLPRYRDRLRWVTLGLVVIAFVTIWAAYLSGDNFLEKGQQFANLGGEAAERIEHHEELADVLRWMTTGFLVVTVLAVWQHAKAGATRYALGGLVVVGAVLTLVWTALTGDAGAQAVWGS
ncbi:hypothetical protein G5V58_14910 [Nocardioides anomalus]|uniref:DUF2231 domain-containing protein n=1 Tax=Nocardioides anomalus TaxID=2712223 RepID=A0A6G6WEY1_9ACTN|nr:DUF2231 domain-containing protein [Nocardioides anomalus]QIG43888.1 hypothetical protein G5V58_14910 [Nocardioides anomalus]